MSALEVVMDYREEHHVPWERCLQKENVYRFSRACLDLGDFHIRAIDTNDPFLILERKTIADFIASIKDGRYTEQKLRMLSFKEQHTTRVGYIVEGSMAYDSRIQEYKSLIGALLNSALRDQFIIFRTNNPTDTIDLVDNIAHRFHKNPALCCGSINDKSTYLQNSQMHILKEKKKDNYDARACFVTQLSCIPLISIKKAMTIAEKLNVSHMFALADLYKSQGPNIFRNISGIGPKIQENLIQYLNSA